MNEIHELFSESIETGRRTRPESVNAPRIKESLSGVILGVECSSLGTNRYRTPCRECENDSGKANKEHECSKLPELWKLVIHLGFLRRKERWEGAYYSPPPYSHDFLFSVRTTVTIPVWLRNCSRTTVTLVSHDLPEAV